YGSTPQPTNCPDGGCGPEKTPVPTKTPKPSKTPKPTKTSQLAENLGPDRGSTNINDSAELQASGSRSGGSTNINDSARLQASGSRSGGIAHDRLAILGIVMIASIATTPFIILVYRRRIRPWMHRRRIRATQH